MSENKENEKKGFFSRLFGGLTASKDTEVAAENPVESIELPTKSALNKMKKADIVALAKDNGLELDIGLTKPNLLKAWDEHFAETTDEIVSNEEVKAEEEVASAVTSFGTDVNVGEVLSVMVIIKVSVAVFPELSVAVTVTVVEPIGKTLPEG